MIARPLSDWLCLDCQKPTELDKHGYAACCGSDAVMPWDPEAVTRHEERELRAQ